jgi:glycosyltransferase involved in cell wall biosynthesis
MKILALRNDYAENPIRRKADGYGGTGYYRMIKPAEQIAKVFDIDVWGKKHEELADSNEGVWVKIFETYDVVWMRHFHSEVVAAWVFSLRDHFKRKVIIDIDDNYLDLPESNPEFMALEKGKAKRIVMGTVFSFADAITVSTEPLKKRLQDHLKEVHGIDKPIYVVPNFNDVNDWNHIPVKRDKRKVVIGYSGSVSHDDDLKLVLPTIVKLMQKYSNLHFQMLGIVRNKKEKEFFKDIPQRIRNRMWIVGVTPMFTMYPEWLSQQPWDIGIAPLVDTAFTRSKSHIKWMEYSMYKIPTVASRVYPYFMELQDRNTIEEGETGLLCTPPEWEAKLEKLILNEDLRHKLGQNAYDFIKKTWQYNDSKIEKTFERIIKDL